MPKVYEPFRLKRILLSATPPKARRLGNLATNRYRAEGSSGLVYELVPTRAQQMGSSPPVDLKRQVS